MPEQEILALYEQGGFLTSPYELRCAALERALSREETVRVLIHLAQRRGYRANSTAEDVQKGEESGKIRKAIGENSRIMAEQRYRTVGEMLRKDERCWQTNPDGSRFHQPRNKGGDYKFTVRREDLVGEIREIFRCQRELGVEWMTEELERDYLTIFQSQRNFDEGPGGDSAYKVDLASQVERCSFEQEEPRAAKASYTFG